MKSVVIIGSKDDPRAGWRRAKQLKTELEGKNISVRLINKLGFVLEDLLFVAKHKVVSTPTVLIFDGDEVVYRTARLPFSEDILQILNA